ncbi:MAG: hypothetical protein QXT76_00105 [Sulfolobales archaeon]
MTQGTRGGDDLAAILKSLGEEELATLRYFLRYRSVGEILASRELRAMGIKNPSKILAKLVSLGLIKRGIGCYTISKEVLDAFRRGEIEI